jgi:hypothetical protein
LGVNKVIYVNDRNGVVPFNPADSVSRFRVYILGQSGDIVIKNNMNIREEDRACKEGYTIIYDPALISTTFSKVKIKDK